MTTLETAIPFEGFYDSTYDHLIDRELEQLCTALSAYELCESALCNGVVSNIVYDNLGGPAKKFLERQALAAQAENLGGDHGAL